MCVRLCQQPGHSGEHNGALGCAKKCFPQSSMSQKPGACSLKISTRSHAPSRPLQSGFGLKRIRLFSLRGIKLSLSFACHSTGREMEPKWSLDLTSGHRGLPPSARLSIQPRLPFAASRFQIIHFTSSRRRPRHVATPYGSCWLRSSRSGPAWRLVSNATVLAFILSPQKGWFLLSPVRSVS